MISRGQSSPAVTVAIPTHNRADGYFPLALESALAQTYPDMEIVVADNCSSDRTPDVVRQYRDPRLRYFRHEPALRPNDNFNFCLRQARGRYLLLLHDDDLVDPDFVDACMAAAERRSGVGVIRTGTRIIDSKGVVIREAANAAGGLEAADLFTAWFDDRIEFYMCSTMYHTAALRELGGFGSRHNLFQDVLATITLAARNGHADVAEVKASFRVHRAELTSAAKVRSWCEDSLDLLERMVELAPAERRAAVRARGEQFLAKVNYSRAARAVRLRARTAAFLLVFRFFGHRHVPSLRLMLSGTRLHAELRRIKRRLLRRPAWVADV